MFDRLDVIEARYEELNRLMMDPALASDPSRLRETSIEHAELSAIVSAYAEHKQAQSELADLDELMADPEMRDMVVEERAALEARMAELEHQLRTLLLPKDPYAGRNLLLEIRAGTGGDEAALFAGDLFRMYQRFCDEHGWRVEVMSSSEVTVGGGGGKSGQGFKEIICLITGKGAYSHLKFESGVHRVQRVPLTETQGRIHTSAATVAVLPEPEEVEVHVDPSEIRVDVFRASGPGGQSVNTTDSAVRLTHEPTGIVVICQDEKSQHKNKAKAMKVLKARLFDKLQAEAHAEEAAARRAQVGSGDRSERIRTYNFPQNRVTDHRINVTLYKLDRVIEGDLTELLTALTAHEQAKLIEEAGLG
ncbi:MAG: peptide chain release factor 1 [Alphaproteobacteria bacterium]|nr:peptide chain release factor 1 [Alphaproteobacteria bacterium]